MGRVIVITFTIILIALIILLNIHHFKGNTVKFGPTTYPFNNNNKTIIWFQHTQLGNGLRSMSSLNILAEELGRTFVIYYNNPMIKMETLNKFTNISTTIPTVNHVPKKTFLIGEHIRGVIGNRNDYLFFKGPFFKYKTNFHPTEEVWIDINEAKQWESKHIAIQTIYSVRPSNLTTSEFNKKRVKWYDDHLKKEWKIRTQNDINKVRPSGFKVIGWHFRYSDNMTDKNKSKHLPSNDILINKVKELNNPNVIFFICTDNPPLVKKLLEKNNIKNYKLAEKQSDLNKPEQGFYEMLLLSSTDLIIGSTASTFSYESSFMGNKPMLSWDYITKKWITTQP